MSGMRSQAVEKTINILLKMGAPKGYKFKRRERFHELEQVVYYDLKDERYFFIDSDVIRFWIGLEDGDYYKAAEQVRDILDTYAYACDNMEKDNPAEA